MCAANNNQEKPANLLTNTHQTCPRLASILNLHEFEKAAKRHLPHSIFSYIANTAEDGRTARSNATSFEKLEFIPRALVNVTNVSQKTSILGTTYEAPFGIAPMGLAALSAYRGDLVMASAAEQAGIPMIMSGSSLIRMETLAQQSPATWFQAYLPAGREAIKALVERVREAGFNHLVITVDVPVATNPDNNRRAGFSSPLRPSIKLAWDGLTHPRWFFSTFFRTIAKHGLPHFENNYASRGAPIFSASVNRDISDRGGLDWEDLAYIRELWTGNLTLKGVLNVDDAVRAYKVGVDALIVSNHGGRQLDGAVSPLTVLPSIVNAVGDIPVMIDSGFRRGTDVLKALALGASFVFIGRPFGYAAAVAGEEGVKHAATLLRNEIARDMALLGITDLKQLNTSFIYNQPNTQR
ncbi:alpha-hydroxy acid oxidase [Halomonas alkaliantarctica]|uniref:Alpha-hydroxy acid oxidase n=1 Tax=Halomonas alkaliantarctica TaxID=232346 RepID=A0ABY8LNS1_9GAMM|nr:alpha-hydroxy acid oxidase [Halomonas alkaliantarctica]WGI25264.1 alpha-hydroxy acid oxidase [Halomonas alkaliantarctica]